MSRVRPGRPAAVSDPRPAAAAAVQGRESTTRNSVTVAGWTLVSRIAGLLRVLVIGALMGPTFLANLFQAGYVLPNTIQTVITGPILATVVIPTLVRALDAHRPTGDTARAAEVLGRISGRVLGIAATGAAALCLTSPALAWALTAGVPEPDRARGWWLTVILILFVAPQVLGYAVAALGVAAQQAQGRFALAAAAPATENVGTILTVAAAATIYGTGLEVGEAPTEMMVLLGAGTTASVLLHAGLQVYGAHRVGLLARPARGWRTDPEAADALRRLLRSVPVAGCPAITQFALAVVASTVAGGVLVVQLSLQVYYALSFLGARAVSTATLPLLAQTAAADDRVGWGAAWRRGSHLAFAASLPALCLLVVFATPTANLLANGELRGSALIGALAGGLTVAAFAQLAGGLHDFGRQALFARLDDRGPRLASYLGMAVSTLVAVGTLGLPADGGRLSGLVAAILAGELASAVWVLARMGRAMRPEPFVEPRLAVAAGLATLAMAPPVLAGRWLLQSWQPARMGELAVLLGCGALSLAAFVVTLRRADGIRSIPARSAEARSAEARSAEARSAQSREQA